VQLAWGPGYLRYLGGPRTRNVESMMALLDMSERESKVNEQLTALLDELHNYGVNHDADKPDRLDRLRNLEPDTAALLALLVGAVGARTLLELGTSNGYSTLWLADAVCDNGGRLVSVEIDPKRSVQAARNLDRARLLSVVELRVQDASEALRQSSNSQWDMIFLDAERPAYAGYWPDLVRVLKPGGLLAVDNVVSHADQVADFRALVSADTRVREALAPTGAGLLLVLREPAR
jgi:predicted O-methyltransferase YrrM